MSAPPTHNPTKLLHLHLYKTTAIHELYNTVCEETLCINHYLNMVHAGDIDHKLVLFNNKDRFHLSGHVNSWKNKFPMLVNEVPLHDVWYVGCANMITRPILFLRKIPIDMLHSNTIFSTTCLLMRQPVPSLINGATAHTANNSINYLQCFLGP
jgi:hypothetical protein